MTRSGNSEVIRRSTSILAVAALVGGVGMWSATPAVAGHGTVDRAAFGVDTNGLVDTDPTPACPETIRFGDCDREVASASVPGVLATGVLKLRTEGTHDPLRADSMASVAEVVALPGAGPGDPAALTANLVTSSCTADAEGIVGDTVIADIDINGIEPTENELTDPDPNSVVMDNALLFIILNEQVNAAGEPFMEGDDQITVNAIRIVAFPGTEAEQEIIISQSQCSFHAVEAGRGYLEICKRADNSDGAVTGKFRFRVEGRERLVTVPVGACSRPLRVGAGRVTVTELRKDGVRMSGCATRPIQRLLRCVPAERKAVVQVVRGGVRKETVLYVTNKRIPADRTRGAIKVCKVAGQGVRRGAVFGFTVGSKSLKVAAGSCKVAHGFDRGSRVRVTENARAGVHVSRLTVQPAGRKISTNKATRTAVVRVGKGFTVVSFTNTAN